MRVRGAVPCLVAVVLLAAGCGVASQDGPDVVPAEQVPAPLASVRSSTASPLPSSVQVYLVGRDGRLARSTVGASQGTPRAALDALLAVDAPLGDLRNAVPPGTAVRAAEVRDGVLAIDVTEHFGLARGRDQLLALAQIVWTVTEFPEVLAVRVGVEGRSVAVPTDGGRTTTEPVGRGSFRSVGPG